MSEFWSMTPYQTRLYFNGWVEHQKEVVKLSLSNSWYSAAFQRSKKLPDLEKVIGGKKIKEQSWQEQLATLKAFDAAHKE